MDATATAVHPVCVNVEGVYMTMGRAQMSKQISKPGRLTKTTPPKKGPVSQGLQNSYKKIQIVKTKK